MKAKQLVRLPFRAARKVARSSGLTRTNLRRHYELLTAQGLGVLRQYSPRPMTLTAGRARLPRNAPRFSMVTPSYNHAAFLERTLVSVLGQRYPNLEYIVQDAASKDGTAEVLARYRDRLAGCRSEKDGGQADAINRGFRGTTGEIMAYLNSDDLLLPGSLARVARYFAKHPDVDVVYGHRVLIDDQDREIGRWVMPPHDNDVLIWTDYVPQETLFWRRGIWERAGGQMDDTFQFALDWDLLLRFRDVGARFHRLPHFLGAFRVHPQQKTCAQIADIGLAEMARLRHRCHGRDIGYEEITANIQNYLRRHRYYNLASRLKLASILG